MTIDRADPAVAEKCVSAFYPDTADRDACLQFLADAVRAAHVHGSSKWGVTLFKRRIRLNVGKCLALELRKGSLRMGLAPTRIPEDLKQKLDETCEWSDAFATFPPTMLCEIPLERFGALRPLLAPHFADFIRIAADTARQVTTARSHSPGVLAYLESAMGTAMPKAEHQPRGGADSQLEEDDDEPADDRAIAVQAPQILFEKVDYSLDNLLTYIETGDIGLPDIQRPFVWSWSKVRDLLDSMYRGYPVGYLLFWANSDVQGARQIGTGAKTHKVPNMLVVDGQQRLTSLYAVFRGRAVLDEEFRERHIEIAFRPRDTRFAVADATVKRDPEFIANVSELWSSNKPVHRIIREFLARLDEKKGLDPADEDAISHNIDRLFDLRKYPFTGLRIMPMVEEEAVASIFVRINSEGVKLNQADFILTLLSVFWEDGRASLEEFSRQSRIPPVAGKASPFNHFIHPSPDQLLRVSVALAFHRAKLKAVYQVLRGKDPVSGGYSPELRDRQFDRLREAQGYVLDLTHWDRFLNALVGAGFRGDEMLSSDTAVLYAYSLFLIGKLQCGVGDRELQLAISRWFFMSALSGRVCLPC
jgi:hypothetical protein